MLECVICFRCIQDTRRLAVTELIFKVIEQQFKLRTSDKIVSNFFEVFVR